MGRRRRWWPVTATTTMVVLVVGACTGTDGRTELKADDDGSDRSESVAAANGFSRASNSMDALTTEGFGLRVEYFEPLRKGDWVAPDHCWFPTRVSVDGLLASPGFRGPSSDDDRDAGDGVLVGSIRQPLTADGGNLVMSHDGEPPYAPGDGTGVATTTIVGSGSGVAGSSVDGPSVDPTTTVAAGGTVPSAPVPPQYEIVDATVVVAAVFGHDQVAELSVAGTPAVDGRGADTAPVDGWALLSVAIDTGATDRTDAVTVRLRRVDEDGTASTEDLEVDLRAQGLQVPERWRFDLAGVDDDCSPPGGDADNIAPTPESDLFGSPIGSAPSLPPPGAQPDDPTAATTDGLAALRSVYDLDDVWAESKKDHLEDPQEYLAMRQELLANDVVRPYMSNLDPTFRNSVFVSPTELHVLYRVGPSYQWEIGRVLLIDGRWRVANGTVCRDLAAAGYRCRNAQPDPSPGPLG